MLITSADNDKIKRYVKLKQKKYRDLYQEFIVEGYHLVIEAYKKGIIKELILKDGAVLPMDVETIYTTDEIMKKISDVETPNDVMAVCSKLESNETIGKKILILDSLQDPGNIGTIIRSSVAFGIDTIVFGKNTVDLYNPKVIRSTQGMLFQVNIIFADIIEYINQIKARDIPVYGTKVNYGEDVCELNSKEKESFALIVGNEGNGLHPEVLEMCDKYLYIKMNEATESLNVAIATSILLYELGKE